MNDLPASPVLPDTSTHRQNDLVLPPAGRQDHTTDAPAGRHRWRPPRSRSPERAQRANGGANGGQTMAGAMQLAIGLLIASLDSPELEPWALQACRFLLALAALMSHATAEPGRPAPRSKDLMSLTRRPRMDETQRLRRPQTSFSGDRCPRRCGIPR